jgi:hypothetical protein
LCMPEDFQIRGEGDSALPGSQSTAEALPSHLLGPGRSCARSHQGPPLSGEPLLAHLAQPCLARL